MKNRQTTKATKSYEKKAWFKNTGNNKNNNETNY